MNQQTGGITGMPSVEKLQAMQGFAESIQNAKFLPKVLRGDVPSIMYVLCIGEDLGLPWTTATRLLYPVTRGKADGDGNQEISQVGIEGKALAALLLSRGWKINVTENTDDACSITLVRPDGTECPPERFTFAQAEAGKLTKVKIYPRGGGPAQEYEKIPYNRANRANQLRWRALGRAANFYAADVVFGVMVKEELEDWVTSEENQTIESGSAPTVAEDYTVGTTDAPVAAIEGTPDAITDAGPVDVKTTEAPKPTAAKKAAAKAPAPAPQPTPAVEQTPPPAADPNTPEAKAKRIQGELAACAKALGSGKAGSIIVVEFTKGFLDVPKPPSDMLLWEPILAPLHDYMERDVETLKAHPHQCGYGAKHNPQFIATMKEWGWPEEVHGKAISFCASSYPGKYDSFMSWMKVITMDQAQSAEDLSAFLTAAEISKVAAVEMLDAIRLPVCKDMDSCYSDLFKVTVSMTKKSVEDLDKATFDEAAKLQIAAINKSNDAFLKQKEEATTQAPAEPVAESAAAAEEQGGFPFGE